LAQTLTFFNSICYAVVKVQAKDYGRKGVLYEKVSFVLFPDARFADLRVRDSWRECRRRGLRRGGGRYRGYKAGRINQNEYKIRKDQIQKGSILQK